MRFRYDDAFVRAALGLGGSTLLSFSAISTDTRSITPGSLFVALKGDRFDGHDYLASARDAGATAAVVRVGTPAVTDLVLYEVPDTLRAWGELANARRRSIAGPVVAITGQNGKTSTKEMVAAVLRTRWKVHATRVNNNNLVGVPLAVREAPLGTDALVVEAGANVPGEIARYREIIEPDIAIVLNAGAGHLAGFGSVERVTEEKLELTRGVPIAITGMTPPELAAGARPRGARKVVTAGLSGTEFHPESVSLDSEGRPRVRWQGMEFTIAARGLHQAGNAMFALAVATELGIPVDDAIRALGTFS